MSGKAGWTTRNPELALEIDKFFRGLQKRNPNLAHRTLKALRRVSSLSQAPGASVVATPTAGHKNGSQAPAEPRLVIDFRETLKWLVNAPNDSTLTARVEEVESECDTYQGRTPEDSGHTRATASEAWNEDGAAMEEMQAKRVLRDYAGKTAKRAAQLEGDPRLEPWIEKIRRINSYDENGYPRSRWEAWDEPTKVSEVRKLRMRYMSVRQVAEHLGVAKTTIHRGYWNDQTHPRKEAA